MMAERLFTQALPAVTGFTSPRAWAFSLIGIHEYLRRTKGDRVALEVRENLTGRLMNIFDRVADPGWTWFEESLTYDNAKLAHALIVSGHATGQKRVSERGIQALRWLVAYRPRSMVNCGPLAATDSTSGMAGARTSTSSPSRPRPPSPLAWKRTAPQPTVVV